MHITHTFLAASHCVCFTLNTDEDDTFIYSTPQVQYTLRHTHFRVLLPSFISSFEDIHPDLWAVVLYLVVCPFVGKSLSFSFAVSSLCADTIIQSGIQISPVSSDIVPRHIPDSKGKSIAFNGRPHALMTAAVVENSATLVAIDHWDSLVGERCTPYSPDPMYYTLDNMETQGFNVAVVKTDFMSMWEPYGFAHPLTCLIGNILLSDVLGTYTMFMGSHCNDIHAYGKLVKQKKHGSYEHVCDYNQRDYVHHIGFKRHQINICCPSEQCKHIHSLMYLRDVLKSVQLRIDFPTCGFTDMMIVKLLHAHKLYDNSHFCLFRHPHSKCLNCEECMYYKTIYDAIIHHSPVVSRVWNLFVEKIPEAVVNVDNMKYGNRWLFFWLHLCTRTDTLPSTTCFTHLQPYIHVFQKYKFMIKNIQNVFLDDQCEIYEKSFKKLLHALK